MAGSRERLLYERRPDCEYDHEFRRRYEQYDSETNRYRQERRQDLHDRPRRKNGYVYEDIYSDFDEAQGRLSLFRPIRPEYLNLPTNYDVKYNSLPRNYYNYDERNTRRYKKDHYDFRIDHQRRTQETYDHYRKHVSARPREINPAKKLSNTTKVSLDPTQNPMSLTKIHLNPSKTITTNPSKNSLNLPKNSLNLPKNSLNLPKNPNGTPKNVAVCKPHRISDRSARYWTSDPPERSRSRPKKAEEPKKNVKFSEVSGCNRKMVVNDPIFGRKIVPVRELEVSLDQMIQNGYFERHNIPISRPIDEVAKEEIKSVQTDSAVPNGKCLSGNGKENQPPRQTRHLPQVS
ncbi:unnamed protein product [Arctia plantaginis]|uniref:Uncharacterized protein n=1 Tax=Arctia plantaginis TaxID=874455 RepID=A0A8S0YPN0_ARCPL|nr:unnamed protein product [Arctia plantaginis]